MDELVKTQLQNNNSKFKLSLDQIIDKYSKLQYQDAGTEVDLDDISPTKLDSYMTLSKKKVISLQLKSSTDVREESLRAQDPTGGSQLDLSSDTSIQLSMEDGGMTRSDVTQLTVSSLDESQRNFSNVDLQPEDQDEELEMSLRSHGSSWVELYPSMISLIKRAWDRQHVSTAADSVLRRYRRWRQQSNRSNLNNTFVVPLRHTNSKPKKMTTKAFPEKSSSRPMKEQFTRTKTTPLQTVTCPRDWHETHQSPDREENLMSRHQHKPVLVMDFSASSVSFKPKEIPLNKTFTVSQLSPRKQTQLEDQASAYSVSPSRPCAKASEERSSLSLLETAGSSILAPEFTAAIQRPDIYGSPVRQEAPSFRDRSPLKARVVTSLGRSPHLFSRSPSEYSVTSREPMRPRSLTASLFSPTKRPVLPPKMLYSQNSQQSFLPHSPQSASAAGGHRRLVRHLSIDSVLPSSPGSCSPKQVDEDFMKLYHKFVCQNKSTFFNSPPCRLCARSSEASRGHSSSALAALALSPHRSVLRKRHRDLDWSSHPQSKRFREVYCTYSPGSKRHSRAMLRQGLPLSELELPRGGSSSKHNMFQRFSSQQYPAHEEYVEAESAADFSGMGSSLESKMTCGYSPRKWR